MATGAEELLALLDADGVDEQQKSYVIEFNDNVESKDQRRGVIESSEADLDNLNKIIETKNQIAQVKDHLSTIIDSIADNPSFLNRASQLWGKMPLWQKVGTGAAISGPAILTGAAASIASLLVIGGVTGIVYTASGIVLQDHFDCSENIKHRLREGISSIADILEITIVALDHVRVRLSEQIARFKEANADLAKKVGTLQDQINTLSIKIEILISTSKLLEGLKNKLELQVIELESNSQRQTELLAETRKELDSTIKDYKKNQQKLEEEVTHLRRVREEMSSEIVKTKQVSGALNQVILDLSQQVVEDKAQKQRFNDKFQSFVGEQENSARTVLERLRKTQEELDEAKKALCANNQQNKELLVRQETLIRSIEDLGLDALRSVVRKETTNIGPFFPLAGVSANNRVDFAISNTSIKV